MQQGLPPGVHPGEVTASSKACPHCAALCHVNAKTAMDPLRLQCPNCSARFLNISPEKLMLGTTVLCSHSPSSHQPNQAPQRKQVQQHQQQLSPLLGSSPHSISTNSALQYNGRAVQPFLQQSQHEGTTNRHSSVSSRGESSSLPSTATALMDPPDGAWDEESNQARSSLGLGDSVSYTSLQQQGRGHMQQVEVNRQEVQRGGHLVVDEAAVLQVSQTTIHPARCNLCAATYIQCSSTRCVSMLPQQWSQHSLMS
jgi:hypothetical protein